MAVAEERYCESCMKVKNIKEFYRSNNLEKFPDDGYINQCKDCLTRHIDNFDPDTYLWILEMIDVPYIGEEWSKLLANYKDKPEKLNGSSILGRYIAKMHLKQWKDYRWKDNQFLQELEESKLKESMKRQGYDAGEIAKTIDTMKLKYAGETAPEPPVPENSPTSWSRPEDIQVDLTDEDIQYLRVKWGPAYRPYEWVQLENLYEDMMNSYKIETAGHKDNLKILCKTSLKVNQLLDLGD